MSTLIRFLIFVGPSGCQPYNCFLLFRCCLLLHLDTIADHHLNIRQRQDRTVSRSRVYNRFLLLLQWTPRLSSLKHPYFHDSSIAMNISYMVGHGGQHRGSSKDDKDNDKTASATFALFAPFIPFVSFAPFVPCIPFIPFKKLRMLGNSRFPEFLGIPTVGPTCQMHLV